MKSYFFNAIRTSDTTTYPSGYDREYDADDHAAFFAPFFSEKGVMAGSDADACRVTVKEGKTLQFHPGAVYIRGRAAILDGTETLEVQREGTVVCRMDKSLEVRAFQLLVVEELQDTEDVCDLALADVRLEAVSGGYQAAVTDRRTFLAHMGQPAYYPPDSESLPYVLWLYTLGFPMDEEQRRMVEENPSLMAVFHASLGASRAASVAFTASEWQGGKLTIPQERHGRRSAAFGYQLRHKVEGALVTNTWAVLGTAVAWPGDNTIVLESEDAYDGEITFFG